MNIIKTLHRSFLNILNKYGTSDCLEVPLRVVESGKCFFLDADNLPTCEIEKERIEEYLRAEVKELWKVIKVVQDFPLYSIYLRIANLYSKVGKKSKKVKKSDNTIVEKYVNGPVKDFDVLFIVTSNKLEIGGITSAYQLANYFFTKRYFFLFYKICCL